MAAAERIAPGSFWPLTETLSYPTLHLCALLLRQCYALPKRACCKALFFNRRARLASETWTARDFLCSHIPRAHRRRIGTRFHFSWLLCPGLATAIMIDVQRLRRKDKRRLYYCRPPGYGAWNIGEPCGLDLCRTQSAPQRLKTAFAAERQRQRFHSAVDKY